MTLIRPIALLGLEDYYYRFTAIIQAKTALLAHQEDFIEAEVFFARAPLLMASTCVQIGEGRRR